ncbi:O-antigen polymerase [Aerococcus urinaeequi]|uniref:O-antigen polymerase n=1 Tax=Aerococcus urinaeequi TaxID=51665 RepID=UPI003D6C2807
MKKTISLKTLLSSVILGLAIFIGTISIFYNVDNILNNNRGVLSSFILNGLIIFLSLLRPSKSPYRLVDVLNVFMFIFMFAAPLVQYMRNSFPWWSTYLITDEVVIITNLVILIFLLFFNLFYSTNTENKIENKNNYIKDINLVLNIFWLLTIVSGLFIISRVGITDLFARSTSSLNIDNQSIGLIVNYSLRSIPVIYVGLSLLYYQKRKKFYKVPKLIVGLVIMILVNFPTGLARFWIGSVYIGLIAIILKKVTKPNFFKVLLLFGLLIVFPSINSFRNLDFAGGLSRGLNLAPLSDYFLAGDFDAFSMLARSIIITKQVGFSWGHQLLGSVFFFIPRAIWPTKPVGSGYTVAILFGWDFVNVSMPLIGEGYINFGIFGVIALGIFMGIVLKKMDFHYFYRVKNEGKKIYFIEIVFPFTLGFLFFIMRGDLLSSWAYYVGFMIPVIILFLINRFVKVSK